MKGRPPDFALLISQHIREELDKDGKLMPLNEKEKGIVIERICKRIEERKAREVAK